MVAIIALLISILLPSLSRARENAKATVCLSNMRGMAQMVQTFALEHEERFQIVSTENGLKQADPGRNKYMYGSGEELLAWPVALAKAYGSIYENNWDWGCPRHARAGHVQDRPDE